MRGQRRLFTRVGEAFHSGAQGLLHARCGFAATPGNFSPINAPRVSVPNFPTRVSLLLLGSRLMFFLGLGMTRVFLRCSNADGTWVDRRSANHHVVLKRRIVGAMRFSPAQLRHHFNTIMASWQRLIKIVGDRYRPELHYMRGPGPKWYAKHQADG
jgi:hypothetical protein